VVPQKGFDRALNAFASLVQRFPGIRLVIAGDGFERPELVQLADRLGLADSVEFTGWVHRDQVPALINRCTLVVMPSRFEPFGIVSLQTAQMARPIVATRVGGLPEVVVDGETGLLVENGDDDALVAAIAFLLENPEIAVSMGQAARRRAREVFSWTNYVDAYESLYRKLMSAERWRDRSVMDPKLAVG
jgi:glycogen(starch) synthase